jgi:hypothetical protein
VRKLNALVSSREEVIVTTAKRRLLALDSLASGLWLPAIVITAINLALFWALFSSIAGH